MKIKVRYAAIIMSLALLTAVFVGISCAANESGEPTLNIASCNLSFRSNICIKYAVDTNNINTKLLVWESPQNEYLYTSQDAILTTVGKLEENGKEYFVYDYTALSVSEMTKDVYARAYLEVDGVAKYGEVVKYSILQHAYNKKGITGTASTNPDYIALLDQMLEFGAAAQRYNKQTNAPLPTDTFAQIELTAGTLPDGFDHGLYKEGTDVEITAPATDESGVTFTYWKDETGANVSSTATFTVTVGTAHKTYTPVYGEEPEVPSALEFESNGDETCYVIGMGKCTDSKIIIPATSPEGDTVKYIDRNAFINGTFTSIKIPSTVTEIGRNAFSGCTALTDVYYDGTEAEWTNIEIEDGNIALTNATKHFKAEAVKTYTVTFKDHDGETLKTETVNQGAGATAPAAPERNGYTFTGWDKPFTNITANTVVTAQYRKNQATTGNNSVTFYDYDGTTVLKTQTGIVDGGCAIPPAAPSKSGATFLGWEGNYANVLKNESVRAVYSDEKNVFVVESATVNPGGTVTVLVSVDGIVKTCGFDIALYYDSDLTLASYNSDLDLDVVANAGAYENGMALNFSATSDKTKQRDIISLTFNVNSYAEGALPISLEIVSIKEVQGNEIINTDYTLTTGYITVS